MYITVKCQRFDIQAMTVVSASQFPLADTVMEKPNNISYQTIFKYKVILYNVNYKYPETPADWCVTDYRFKRPQVSMTMFTYTLSIAFK